MFEELDRDTLADAEPSTLVALIGDAARTEAMAAGARAAAIGVLLARNEAAHDPRWVFDGFNATAAEVGAAMGLSPRRAATLVRTAAALRDRLPRIGELLSAGVISERVAAVMCWRTGLVTDPAVAAAVDADLAAMATTAGVLSDRDLEQGIDAAICAHDPDAGRRVHQSARYRDIQFGKPDDAAGVRSVFGAVTVDDGAFLEARLQALVATVCREDPRTNGERRADALRVAVTGAAVLPCHCNRPECPQALAAATGADGAVVDASRAHVVIHVLADQAAIEAAIREAKIQADLGTPWLAVRHMVTGRCPADLVSRRARRAEAKERRRMTRPRAAVSGQPGYPGQSAVVRVRANAACRGSRVRGRRGSKARGGRGRAPSADFRSPVSAPSWGATAAAAGTDIPPISGVASGLPAAPPAPAAAPVPGVATGVGVGRAVLLGGAIVPGPLLAEMVRTGAKLTALKAPSLTPEPGYRPSTALAWFVRARDLRCRFPGCSRPAEYCDIDHVEPWPGGPTHPGNTACLCRLHHIAKTHHGWQIRLDADATVTVASPHGQSYRSPPPAAVLFPQWNITTPVPSKAGAVPQETGPRKARSALAIPRRSRTRAAEREWRIQAERDENHIANAAYNATLEPVLGPLSTTRPEPDGPAAQQPEPADPSATEITSEPWDDAPPF